MRLLIDTNRYSELRRQDPEVTQVVADASEIFVPFIVLAELHVGFLKGARRQENERLLDQFLSRPSVRSLYPDELTTSAYANLHVILSRQGTPIPTNDIWIAALALQHSLTLYSRDRHFDHLPQVARL